MARAQATGFGMSDAVNRRELKWVHRPLQARSRETLERILTATEAMLTERDFGSISVSEIALAGGSSVGAFYARFKDKEGLLHLIHERFCEEALATIQDALDPKRWEGIELTVLLDALVTFMVQTYRERAGLLRAFLLYGCVHEDFQKREQRLSNQLNACLSQVMASRLGEIQHPRPDTAVVFGLQMMLSTLQAKYVVSKTPEAGSNEAVSVLIYELSRAYRGYLGLGVGTPEV